MYFILFIYFIGLLDSLLVSVRDRDLIQQWITFEESLGCEKCVFMFFDDKSAGKISAIIKWVLGPSKIKDGTSDIEISAGEKTGKLYIVLKTIYNMIFSNFKKF